MQPKVDYRDSYSEPDTGSNQGRQPSYIESSDYERASADKKKDSVDMELENEYKGYDGPRPSFDALVSARKKYLKDLWAQMISNQIFTVKKYAVKSFLYPPLFTLWLLIYTFIMS